MIRKQLYWMMGLVMVLTSCQKEETTSPDETIFQTITVSIPQEVGTRGSTGDGSLINRCILQVYRNEQPVGERQTVAITGSTITFNVSLSSQQTYDLVFWADCATRNEDGFEDKFYDTGNLEAVTLKNLGNNDQYTEANEYDAFSACVSYKATGNSSGTVILTRPFGRVNIRNSAPFVTGGMAVSVTYRQVATQYNVRTKAVSEWENIARTFSPTVAGSDIICEDFILVPEDKCQQAIDVTVGNVSRQFVNLPLQRNYATNITATFEKSGGN